MRNRRKFVSAVLSTCMIAVAALAGCSQPTASDPGKSGDSGPFRITIMNSMMFTEPPKMDSDVFKKIMEYTNTKLDIVWSPGSVHREKTNAAIASNDLPMALMVWEDRADVMINAIRSGMFWEIGPYLKDYPNLNKLNKQILTSTSVDGKNYGLPRSRPIAQDGMVFRRDWLDNLGLKEPKTLDELYNVIKALGTQDPDRNGKNDTLGMVEYKDLRGFDLLLGWTGTPNEWELKDGKLSPSLFTKEYLDALKFMRRLFSEKLLNQDFGGVDRSVRDDLINKGTAGFELTGIDQVVRYSDLLKVDSKAKMDVASRVIGPKGDRQLAYRGYNGVFFFPKPSVKTEADLKKILAFFDKLGDEPMQNLTSWGIEGVHYTMKDGKAGRTKEQADLYLKQVFELNDEFLIVFKDKAMPGEEDPINDKWKKHVADNEPIAVFNPAAGLISKTLTEKKTDLDKIYLDARIKFIMGLIDEAGWQKALDDWKKAGGDKVIDEINVEYAKFKK